MTVNAESTTGKEFPFRRLAQLFEPAPAAAIELEELDEIANEYRRWQRRVPVSSIIGYATFYFVRKNLSVAMRLMERSLAADSQTVVQLEVKRFTVIIDTGIAVRPCDSWQGKGRSPFAS